MYIGDDEIKTINHAIYEKIDIQGFIFQYCFYVVPQMMKKICIIGDDLLSKINAVTHWVIKPLNSTLKISILQH